MAINNLTTVQDGDTISSEDVNQNTQALKGDHVPRNASGVPTTRSGSLGTPSLEWNNIYARRLFLQGSQITGSGGGGGGTTTAAFIRNGVISGRSPNGRPGMCGWMHRAGTSGITLRGSSDNPLIVTLGGQEYSLVEDITGGTPLPAEYSTNGYSPNIYNPVFHPGTDATLNQRLVMSLNYSSYNVTGSSIPASIGDTLVLDIPVGGGREYIVGARVGSANITATMRGMVNTHATDYNAESRPAAIDIVPSFSITIRAPFYIFADPTTAEWTISTERRILGSVGVTLPDAPSYPSGTMVFRDLDSRWYRSNGSSWVITSRVFLGTGIRAGSSVVGVIGVRSSEALSDLQALGQELDRPLQSEVEGSNIHFYPLEFRGGVPTTSATGFISGATSTIELEFDKKPIYNLAAQGHRPFKPLYTIDSGDYTLQAGSIYGVYLDATDGETIYVARDVAPILLLHNGVPFYAHPRYNAAFIGSFGTAGNSTPIGNFHNYGQISGATSIAITAFNSHFFEGGTVLDRTLIYVDDYGTNQNLSGPQARSARPNFTTSESVRGLTPPPVSLFIHAGSGENYQFLSVQRTASQTYEWINLLVEGFRPDDGDD